MKIAYFDCFSGVSGDMLLGAMVDAGLSEAELKERLSALHLPGFDLSTRKVIKNGISATKVDVAVTDEVAERRLPEILEVVEKSELPQGIKERAVAILKNLGEVEAKIHGMSSDQVHLHELGGLDTIVDVVGALAGLEALGVGQVHASPLPLGRGFTLGAHGQLPLPAPATMALLEGIPVVGSDLDVELVTPTGAAILAGTVAAFGPIPAMRLVTTGYGAGGRDLPIPNVLRLLLGEPVAAGAGAVESLVMLETNLDDLIPEIYDYVMGRLFEAGALDVTLSPLQMKKNRPGTLLSVLCQPAVETALVEILFAETSTLGVRHYQVQRTALAREIRTVETPYGPVRVKVAKWGTSLVKFTPEYADCRKLAEERHVPLREVYQAAEFAARRTGIGDQPDE
jgi:uncharacterized protein (TIGR00299 family) protein